MRGKVGLVIGIGIGYVLGTRAGRERYEQIKAQAMKVWNLDPVQNQVSKVTDFAKSSAMALPGALWDGAVKVSKAAGRQGTPGEKLDAALKAGADSADDVKKAADVTIDEVAKAADAAVGDAKKAAAPKAAPKRGS
jgi:hypothetical protein